MTEVLGTRHESASSRAKPFAQAFRDLLKTIAVYLTVAAISGVSYVVCTIALKGGLFARLWLASVIPIALLLIARSLLLVYRRRIAGESTLLEEK